jgi:peptidoglycan hydrolase-like protein with peptidoglycan-binding domain
MIHQSNSRLNAVQEVSLADYTGSSSAIVMIIRIDYTKWGGTNAANAPLTVNPSSGDNNNNNNNQNANVAATENPGDPYPVPTADVMAGSTSAAGKWVQTALNKVDNAGLEVDGNIGSISTAAIKTFQTKYGLTQSGNADMATINKLVELYKSWNSVTAVSIAEATEQGLALDEGKTLQLTAKCTPDTVKNVTYTWESSNKDVAEVNTAGLVTGTGGGEVTITVKTTNGKTASVKINVKAKARKNEWRRGKWYDADGKQTYEYVEAGRAVIMDGGSEIPLDGMLRTHG